MIRHKFLLFLLILVTFGYSQNDFQDDKYREDQIYLGVFYNSLNNTPDEFNQNKFSSSVNFGFIRDFPLNENRNFGLGIGLGISKSSYHSNLIFSKTGGVYDININTDFNSFKKNKLIMNELEFPFEIRWRTSSPTNYRFWRIYLGLKTSYILNSKIKYESEVARETISNLPFNKFQYGFTLNAGNNTWNLGLFIGLNPLFNDQFIQNHSNIKNIKQFKVGLVFYIL